MRTHAFSYNRPLPVLIAATIGYLVGGWHPTALHASRDPSAAESVALRFPADWDAASPAGATNAAPAAGLLDAAYATTATANDGPRVSLLSPEPMAPLPRTVAQVPQTAATAAPMQVASAEVADPRPAAPEAPPRVAVRPRPAKPPALAARHPAPTRPGYMLDDAQIASIKERLHLTPDQQRMWPAVEVALRNIAYSREQGRDRSPAGGEVDPESVQDLKSAAVPLIMSFDDEQKQEVRNLAHVMGLDQLASQF